MNTTIITTTNLTKRFGRHLAVDNVSLTVRAGEVYGFLGPNGAGKTTTLRMLLGLVSATSGTASVFSHAPGSPAALVHTGALIEGPGFYPYLSGRDNLQVMARYRRLGEGTVRDALERVDLATRADDAFRTYSLGMKQRLGVASALLGAPDLLVLDEPTNGLDPAGMSEMRRLIAGLAAQGHTVLLSSHLLSEVEEICDRVGVIADGRLVAESTVADLRGTSSLFVRGRPADVTLAVAMEIAGDERVELTDDGGVRIDLGATAAPELARALVHAGVDVQEIRVSERSLEDAFFAITRSRTAPILEELER